MIDSHQISYTYDQQGSMQFSGQGGDIQGVQQQQYMYSNSQFNPPQTLKKSQMQFWKKNDVKAQKNGSHRTIYWVEKRPAGEDGTVRGEKWKMSNRYIGDWDNNKKQGFGIQIYRNGDKYQGMWSGNQRHGQGTYWKNQGNNKLRRQYTGDWYEGMRHGRGTFFFKNGDRYDGYWVAGRPHGQGRMIYGNGDIYQGRWHQGKRNGYGVLTKRTGDHFEGHWVNDKREGQGSYYFSDKGKLFVGEWVNDQPKSGVYTEVEDQQAERAKTGMTHFDHPYQMPHLPAIKLKEPTEVLQVAMEKGKKERARYRAKFTPIQEMFTPQELADLKKAFDSAGQGLEFVNMLTLKTLFAEMDIHPTDQMLDEILKSCGKDDQDMQVDFALFARAVALILEENLQADIEQEEAGDLIDGEEGLYMNGEQYEQQYQHQEKYQFQQQGEMASEMGESQNYQ